MTREQIIEKIKTFAHADLSKDEFFELGKMHRELPVSLRDWTWLAEVTGWKKSAEAYRCFVKGRLAKLGELKQEQPIEETSDSIDELVQARQNLFKERQKLRDERTCYNRTLRNESRIEILKDYIKDVADKYFNIKEVNFNKAKAYECEEMNEAVYGFADLHLGMETNNYVNEYNYDVARQRVKRLAHDIVDYCRTHSVYTLHFINMGDLISGVIHPTIRLEQEFDVVEQTMRAGEMTAELVSYLASQIPQVTYRSVVDNHSRMIADKNEHIEIENLNKIIDWFVQERLHNVKNVTFCNDNLDIGVGKIKLRDNKNFIFMHGHQDRKSSIVQDMMGLTREFPDYVLMAHYHNSAEHTFQGAKVYITGSIVGTDTYAFNKRLFGQPEQKLLIFDYQHDNVLDINIRLN